MIQGATFLHPCPYWVHRIVLLFVMHEFWKINTICEPYLTNIHLEAVKSVLTGVAFGEISRARAGWGVSLETLDFFFFNVSKAPNWTFSNGNRKAGFVLL